MIKVFKFGAGIIIACVILGLTGCAQSPVRNPFAGRFEPKLGELPPVSQSTKFAKIMWSTGTLAKQERFSKLVPLVVGQTLYAADHTGKVLALDNKSGNKLWRNNTKHKFSAGPGIVDNLIVLTTSDAKVVALEAKSGQQLWETKVSTEVLAPPAGKNGIILIHAIDGSVSALNAQTGEKLWVVNHSTPSLTLHFNSAPVVVGDKALVGFSSGKLLALNLYSGVIEWERTIALPQGRSEIQRMVDISADPLIVQDTAYVITYQGKMAAVNINTGNLLWEREISSYQNMAVAKDLLFVTDNAHSLWAINRHSGTTHWRQNLLAERYITGPTVVADMVAVADRGGYLHFLSTQKGHLIGRLSLFGKIYQGPISVGNEIIINAHNGKMAAVLVAPKGSV